MLSTWLYHKRPGCLSQAALHLSWPLCYDECSMLKPARLITFLICSLLCIELAPSVFATNLSVTATVPAQAKDYTAILSSDDSQSTVGQNKTIEYTLKYGTTLTYDTSVSLKASWTRGTVDGSNTPSTDILEYVTGSATNAYGNATPVVDIVNRTITWTISSLPGNTTDKTVSFKLRTSNSVTSTTKILFSVRGILNGPDVITPESSIDGRFKTGTNSVDPTNTPTPTPSTILTTTPVPTSPTPTQTPFVQFNDIVMRTISSDQVTVGIELSSPGSISIKYGTSLIALDSTLNKTTTAENHLITLTDLNPGTNYYFQVVAKVNNKTIRSDIFSIITGQEGDLPLPVVSTLVVTGNSTILSSPLQTNSASPEATKTLLLPADSVYEFRITIPNAHNLKLAQAIVRNHNTLGIASFIKEAQASTEAVDLIEISPDIFAGKLKTSSLHGVYDIFLRLSDINGNITEKKISQLRVTRKFTVLDKKSRQPIEDARILISLWSQRKNRYEVLRSESTSIENPVFTMNDGKVNLILPRGKYQALVSSLNYKRQTITFSIGNTADDGYPEVLLNPQPFNFMNAFNYFKSSFQEVFMTQTADYLANISISKRMIDLISLTAIISFIILSILSMSSRVHVSLFELPHYFIYLYKRSFTSSKHSCTLSGMITDAHSDNAVNQATIYVREGNSGRIISHALTNSSGRFTLRQICSGPYTLHILKDGYLPFILSSVMPGTHIHPLAIALSSKHTATTLQIKASWLLTHFLSISFEGVMLLCLLFAVSISMIVGVINTLPLLGLVLFNLITWSLHRRYV